MPALMNATRYENTEIVRLLLSHEGIDINNVDVWIENINNI